LRAAVAARKTGVGWVKATVGSAVPVFPEGLAVDQDVASPDNSQDGGGGKGGCTACRDVAGASMVVSLVPAAAVTPQFRILRHLRRRQDASGREVIFQMGFAQ
jgi:hypothetical protein